MDGDKYHVSILIGKFYGLLHLAVDIGMHQAAETTHTVVYMNHIITYVKGHQVIEREPFAAGYLTLG